MNKLLKALSISLCVLTCASFVPVLNGCASAAGNYTTGSMSDEARIFLWAILFGVLALIALCVFIYLWCKQHKDFIKKAYAIKNGMTVDEVRSIMGCSATTAEEEGNKFVAIWEKSQWKGIQNGGTVVRSVKVVFENGIVVSVVRKNLDKSTFF